MNEIICPLCGKSNPPDLAECQYCQAPLKTGGFLAEPEGEGEQAAPPSGDTEKPSEKAPAPGPKSSLEAAIPDWLKQNEASFFGPPDVSAAEPGSGQVSEQIDSLINPPARPSEPAENAIDDDWLASLLEEAGAVDNRQAALPQKPETNRAEEALTSAPASEIGPEFLAEDGELPAIPTSPAEKPEWLTSLEAASKIKFEGGIFPDETEPTPAPAEPQEEIAPESPVEQPDWLTKAGPAPVEESPNEAVESPKEVDESPKEAEAKPGESEGAVAAAELPGWLEALRPLQSAAPSGPVEDVSGADLVTAGPLTGLRGVLAPQPSAIRPQKPPTYSIKLKVTDDQQTRLRMMEELLADEEKPKPLPSRPIITPRHIFRLIVAIALLLPMVWMIISNSQQSVAPQPGSVPGVVDFTQRIQALPANATVLIAFDYEAGFSGEMNIAITNVLSQLMKKNAYLALVGTSPAGPALAENSLHSASSNVAGNAAAYKNYANLGYVPGGTLGLLGLATAPRNLLPYALDGSNVWAGAALKPVTAVKDFAAVVVITNDPDTARMWIEQVGPQLQQAGTPLLFIASAQAEPLIRPYYQAVPAQVQGLIGGLIGGLAYAQAVGNYQPNGTWDAFSAGITISILIILIGSIAGVVMKLLPAGKKKEL